MGDTGTEPSLQRPYLLRAMHEWMTDNGLTPHIVIDVAAAQTSLPVEYANDGKLVINVSYSATQNLSIGNESIAFGARFGGVSRHLDVPILAILGIYARESGQGMIFSSESAPARDDETESDTGKPERSAPQLTIIK
jgi:stringent starvation protein B